jgi:nitrate/TMAO reductase-like tetraheme cytochrome c subunit
MKLPKSYYNPLSIIGSVLAGSSVIIFLFSLLAMSILDMGGSYMGLFIFIILPIFLILGLILIPIGMVRRSKRIKRAGADGFTPKLKLDLNDPRQFNGLVLFLIGSFLFLFLSGIGSYKAFHYSESNEFCGLLCHQVMEPEYTAYQESVHSQVTCVECHVGEGAEWFVKSKITGLYQVYAVLTKIYPKPIPTPIESLRPARETCEHCHWPEKFYSDRLVNEKHYLADSANTEWNITLKMKLSAGHSSKGLLEGIHWHINPDVEIEYISSDDKREFIPWVRYINKATGDTIIYQDIYESLDADAADSLDVRLMDCIDCHNRPSHNYLVPQKFTDHMIAEGKIPVELPDIKMLAMTVFNTTYPTKDTARMMINSAIQDYYEANYPEIVAEKSDLIQLAKEGFMEGYSKNIFPEMTASWDSYPNHIGHVEYNGCFRCHNGNHVSADERVISRDCNLCHVILAQGTNDDFQTASINADLEFVHPVDIDQAWKEFTCADCHRYLY